MSIFSGIGSLLGIGDDHGDYYKNRELNNKGTQALAEMLDAARSGKVSDAGKRLQKGEASLADVLSGLSGDEIAGLAASPIFGQNVAQQEVLNDPVLAGLFGQGGQLGKAQAEADRLSTQGFKLQPEDIEAYGQASGNIARMFGKGEQSLASALANRGLAAGGSGAGAAQFSGLMGNKNEQLGQMQMHIANQRMQNTMQRLAQTRSYINSLGSLGAGAEQNAVSNNLNANHQREAMASDLAGNQRGDYGAAESARQASMESQQGAEKQNLGDALSNGIFQGVQGGASSLMGSIFAPSAPKLKGKADNKSGDFGG